MVRWLRSVLVGGVIATALAAEAGAQATPPMRSLAPAAKRGAERDVPAAYRPPPGMCRIWIDHVPAAQQPAPTDCATAIRKRPSNGRVIFSREGRDDEGDSGGDRDKARDRGERREQKAKKPGRTDGG